MKTLILTVFSLLAIISCNCFAASTDAYHTTEQSSIIQDTTSANGSILRVRGEIDVTADTSTQKLSGCAFPLKVKASGVYLNGFALGAGGNGSDDMLRSVDGLNIANSTASLQNQINSRNC